MDGAGSGVGVFVAAAGATVSMTGGTPQAVSVNKRVTTSIMINLQEFVIVFPPDDRADIEANTSMIISDTVHRTL